MRETGVFKPYEQPGGLINNERVQDRAMGLTSFKEGRMPTPKVVGVLVGEHRHGIGTITLNVAHFVETSAFEPTSNTRVRRHSATTVKADRKGYHSFRCGDMVHSTSAEHLGAKAMVFGVAVAKIRDQTRRFLVLCEQSGPEKDCEFFVGAWANWTRHPPDQAAEPDDFDPDDDDSIAVASPELVKAALKVRLVCVCMSALHF
eukprot:6214603-Pleurochrysis_carterae.AAC.2